MRKLLILTALSLLTAGTTGCFHNGCSRTGGLFAGFRQPTPANMQCCQPVQCCDPCAGGATVTGPVMATPGPVPMSMPMQTQMPCCP